MIRLFSLFVVTAVAGSCVASQTQSAIKPSPTAVSPISMESLRQRPLRVLPLASGDQCRPGKTERPTPRGVANTSDYWVNGRIVGLGDGPVYVNFYGYPKDTLAVSALHKVGFFAAPETSKLVLIRGAQRDGANQVLFANPYPPLAPPSITVTGPEGVGAVKLYPELDWLTSTFVYVGAPGCYAFQVDGEGFTEIIEFKADTQRQNA